MDFVYEYPWTYRDDGSSTCQGHHYRLQVQPLSDGCLVARATLIDGDLFLERSFAIDYNAMAWLEGLDMSEFGARVMRTSELEDILHRSSSAEELDMFEILADQVESFLHAVISCHDGTIHIAETAGGDMAVCGVSGKYTRYLSKTFWSDAPGFCRQCAEWVGFDVDESYF